jgi:hypothetical protein
MFNPITASENIKRSFEDYIVTSFSIADKVYENLLRTMLQNENMIAKGPYLDIGDSYETGKNIRGLIQEGEASPLFAGLESEKTDGGKEIPIDRPLYLHQENALVKANRKRNLVVTTGTGSGKTECFIIPIINELLRECEQGILSPGVRAILIYPMNSLVNDQMKRLRLLLKDCDNENRKITFGVYNSSTEHFQSDAERKYGELYRDERGNALSPLKNEIISREKMQDEPPNILVTNYAMLEYMMLRPNDDRVFSGAQLKFIILDEAHIYKGATGMETSLLMRRLKARISEPDQVRYILTSATLGDKDSDGDIVSFAENLCDANFTTEDIIRSQPVVHAMPDDISDDIPMEVFREINEQQMPPDDVLKKYSLDFSPDKETKEKLFELGIRSRVYHLLRSIVKKPMTVNEIVAQMNQQLPITPQDMVNIISVLVRGEKNKTCLMKARYHTFVRALEGAYITLKTPKKLFLQRTNTDVTGDDCQKVFECAVCDDCGRIAIYGEIKNGILEMASDRQSKNRRYFLIKEREEREFLDEEEENEESGLSKWDYLVCARCGAVVKESMSGKLPCDCGREHYIAVREAAPIKNSGQPKCPACNYGDFRSFYLGNEAATAVLATTLYEELPDKEVVFHEITAEEDMENIFGTTETVQIEKVMKERQFLCFSDSRSEAAYFACYLSNSNQEFLRRRGIWHVIQKNRQNMQNAPWEIKDFVEELTAYFNENRTFSLPEDTLGTNLTSRSRKNAWIAALNEMFNARRNTSLVSLGVLSYVYKGNNHQIVAAVAKKYNLSERDAKALLELLAMDIVYYGAIQGDVELTDADREYVFYAPKPKLVTLCKTDEDVGKSYLSGWAARTRKNNPEKYYKNARLVRVMNCLGLDEKQANNFLRDYWKGVLTQGIHALNSNGNGEYYFKTDRFQVKAGGDYAVYQCRKCSRITTYNCLGKCVSVTCNGDLEPISIEKFMEGNHYVNLYSSDLMAPLHIKEHTAQLGKQEQQKYQQWFIEKKINVLSCSTTFEMGVDVGSLETVYLRNVPPSPANYVQRAGRAGRSTDSAAFCLTYAKLSSHDFTYYENPVDMISGKINVPLFIIENEKVIYRHVFAIALSSFFARYSEIYDLNNANRFLNEGGMQLLADYLGKKPENLKILLERSIPQSVHDRMGITDFGWVDKLLGPEGILTIGYNDYKDTISWYEHEYGQCVIAKDYKKAVYYEGKLKNFRRSPEDQCGKNDLIEFLVRNNVLPKYGFPVDTVELYQNMDFTLSKQLQMVRDLQLAVAEYAPGSQVVADGKMYTSRYIRKLPAKTTGQDWEISQIVQCPNPACKTMNYCRVDIPSEGEKCIACGHIIEKARWEETIEPRKGFVAEDKPLEDIPMRRPERNYRSDDFYIGDKERKQIAELAFEIGGNQVSLQSTTNDSLVVVCDDVFFVCPFCGYTESGRENKNKPRFNPNAHSIEKEHSTAFGKKCAGKRLHRYKLSHTFKTDVVKITFDNSHAKNESVMLSVLYALLEAVSKELDIERTDIKGCLQKVLCNQKMVHAVILYDAVAGGAGHVRRIITDDGLVLKQVIEKAVDLTKSCDCEPSCYKCLRNYYNQKIHDRLNRNMAEIFLSFFSGTPKKHEHAPAGEDYNEKEMNGNGPLVLAIDESESYRFPSHENWNSCTYFIPDEYQSYIEQFEQLNIRFPDFADAPMKGNGQFVLMSSLVWKKEKVILIDDSVPDIHVDNWTCIKLCNTTPEQLKKLL